MRECDACSLSQGSRQPGVQGTGQKVADLVDEWGNGLITDEVLLAAHPPASSPAAFFQELLTKPYLKQVPAAPALQGPAVCGHALGCAGCSVWPCACKAHAWMPAARMAGTAVTHGHANEGGQVCIGVLTVRVPAAGGDCAPPVRALHLPDRERHLPLWDHALRSPVEVPLRRCLLLGLMRPAALPCLAAACCLAQRAAHLSTSSAASPVHCVCTVPRPPAA